MSFLETPRLPDDIAFWAKGGVGFKTDIAVVNSGLEQRNQVWQYAKGKWDIAEALRLPDGTTSTYRIGILRDFYRAVKGQLYGFRFKDFIDYQDDTYGTLVLVSGNSYQMIKTYSSGALSDIRLIQKPVASTIKIYKNTILQTLTTDYTINSTTGIVTFVADPTGSALTWTGEFDVPVRFATDQMDFGMGDGGMYSWGSIPIIEIRL